MSVFFSPRFPIATNWRSTVQTIGSILGRVRFVTENTFSFGNFNPSINWNGMAISGLTVDRARYLKIFSFAWISLRIRVTLAAPLTNYVGVNLPVTAQSDGFPQAGSTCVISAGTLEAGEWLLPSDANEVKLYRAGMVNYAGAAVALYLQTFLEVQ